LTVRSMTGYAVETHDIDLGTITIEIKSVNSRFLDLQFRINDDLRAIEPLLRDAIAQRVVRGKVECRVSFGRKPGDVQVPALNPALLSILTALQQEIRSRMPDAQPLSVNELLRWPGMIEEPQVSQESLQAGVVETMSAALDSFVESRTREGVALCGALVSRIDAMEGIVRHITPLVPQIIEQFQQKAMQRMQEALGLSGENGGLSREEAMERIRQEVTIYGIRIDIAEELSRLSAHLAETRHILSKGGQVGKRLDFMMQELNREANTVGSKAAIKELADASMSLKLLIDQMREQVQNLE
jgi:uncharacterized protein (TIGR00255 family)